MATSLIEKLNGLVGKTPDQITANLSDPLNQWLPMLEMTQDIYDKHISRQIAMWHESEGFYSTRREFFTQSSSYRTREAESATAQGMSPYYPESARGCTGWWFIGFEHKDTPVPCLI